MGKPGIGLTCVLRVFAPSRLRLRDFPLTRDGGNRASSAQLGVDGVPPYTAVYGMRMPGSFACLAPAAPS